MFHFITIKSFTLLLFALLLTAFSINHARAGDFSISIGFGVPIGYYQNGYVIDHDGHHYIYVPNRHYYPPKHYYKHNSHHYYTRHGYRQHKGFSRHEPRALGYFYDYNHHRGNRNYRH